NIKAIVVGDSHAESLATAVGSAYSTDFKNSGIVVLNADACPLILNAKRVGGDNDCYKINLTRMEYLESHFVGVPVFWISRTGVNLYGQSNPKRVNSVRDTQPLIYFTKQYTKAEESLYEEFKVNLSATIERISEYHPMYIVQPTPEMRTNVPKTLAKNMVLGLGANDLSIDYNLYLQRNGRVRDIIDEVAITGGIQVLDPAPYLCRGGRCIAQLEGRPIYLDGDHMSEYGNKLLTPMFKAVIEK
ncbi:MAG: SGNH hydrolase domain-containing protein, partial [Colwellia sp.]